MCNKFFTVIIGLLFSLSAVAHDFYINLTEPFKERPKSVIVNLGWGHMIPMDDFFEGKSLKSYEIYDPTLKKANLKFDKKANYEFEKIVASAEADAKFPSAKIFSGDIFANKIYFDTNATEGVYQVAASTEKMQFSWWKDAKGRSKWDMIYLDEIKDAKEILLCFNFQSFAKAFISYGKWARPKLIGHDLEFLPVSDLSNVKVGDVVEFEVFFMGEPLHEIVDGMPLQIRAYGEQSEAGFVGSFVMKGKTKFKVTSSGKWVVNLSLKKPVNKDIAPELIGKALHKGYNASATFFVKEK